MTNLGLRIILRRCLYLEYIESNGTVMDELERIWKEAAMT
jgi:hypothetical protein